MSNLQKSWRPLMSSVNSFKVTKILTRRKNSAWDMKIPFKYFTWWSIIFKTLCHVASYINLTRFQHELNMLVLLQTYFPTQFHNISIFHTIIKKTLSIIYCIVWIELNAWFTESFDTSSKNIEYFDSRGVSFYLAWCYSISKLTTCTSTSSLVKTNEFQLFHFLQS